MFRRPKLLITAILLLAFSIAVGDLMVNWSPQKPLRFRIIPPSSEKLEKSFSAGTAQVGGYQVDVENTTGATIHLLRAELVSPEDSDGSRVHFSIVQTMSAASEDDLVIPPHGSRRLVLEMFEATYVTGLARSEMTYTFLSRSKENYLDLLDYVSGKWPHTVSSRWYPHVDGDFVPVEVSGQ
ncbi:hypothetical protein DES53_115124 [Roseimicrobium gellanilyticum]|uniref:Uncharacterized protein n=1 Tax=Roseimicrobium gellanilyticum TaxID=748857 RepID=A0A366H4P7_9BACT|nr:hypothetical protein [Roseimicrobium gellanilyticum]RBP36983.1 hypothetical protein DES53_115124 [Roseimicrobium gellanilyticum]